MKRYQRLLILVKKLQCQEGQYPHVIARELATSKRTVYRDLQALCEMGVPVEKCLGRYRIDAEKWANWKPEQGE
ncbi:MAG: HTH domain-containing protein [Candidatus Zixiibacteriota bacterium]|nr:MAG: HTH domain-containing protein [candidate division Zixibacteria bacterium]